MSQHSTSAGPIGKMSLSNLQTYRTQLEQRNQRRPVHNECVSFRSRRPFDRKRPSTPLLLTTSRQLRSEQVCQVLSSRRKQYAPKLRHIRLNRLSSTDAVRKITLCNSTWVTDSLQSHNQLRGADRSSWMDLESLDLTYPLSRIHPLNHLNCLWTISNPSLRDRQTTATLSSGTAFEIEWTRARAPLPKGSISPTSLDPTHQFKHYAGNHRVIWSLTLVHEHGENSNRGRQAQLKQR